MAFGNTSNESFLVMYPNSIIVKILRDIIPEILLILSLFPNYSFTNYKYIIKFQNCNSFLSHFDILKEYIFKLFD